MTGKQLKNSILQWAIQGKLVPQDPNDEPASVLLEKIRAEKARLIKEGKIKKDKNESIIYRGEDNSYYEKFADGKVVCIDDEIPFEIPATWEWCRIKHLFSMQAGKNIKAFELSDTPTASHTYPCYGGNGLRGYVDHYNTEGNFILVGRQGALCGNVKEVKGKFYATEHAVVTNGYGLTNLQWAYYFLWALDLNQYATATAQPGLAVSNIIEVLIPLPPFEEQIRIASKIDNTLQYVDSFSKAQKDLEVLNNEVTLNLRKSILQEAIQGKLVPQDPNDEPASVLLQRIKEEKLRLVKEGKLKKKDVVDSVIFKGDDNKYYEQIGQNTKEITEEIPFEIPTGWEWCRMGTIGIWGAGSTPAKGNPNYYGGNILWLRTGELNNSVVYDTEIKITQKALEDCSLRMNKIGDVMIAMYGATIGKVAIAGAEMTTNQACCACTPIGIFNWYLFYFLMASQQDFIKKGEGGAQPNISREKLISHMIPIPPLAEQRRIVATLKILLSKIKGN